MHKARHGAKLKFLAKEYNNMKHRSSVNFTLEEYLDLYLDSDTFNKLYSMWEASGFATMLKPSMDRINCRFPYSLGNIRMVTWKENRLKGDIEVSIQKMKPVVMKCRNGLFVHEFDSLESASRITGYSAGHLSSCCNGKKKSKKMDFTFSYKLTESEKGG